VSANATLAAWQTRLLEIGALGDALAQAIQNDDLVGAIAAMMQLRGARSEVARVETSTAGLDSVDTNALATVKASLVASRGVQTIMSQWLARPLPADTQLLASPLGVAVLADAMLPASWDFERDLALLIGDELAPVATVLADLGQRRIIFLGKGELPATAIAVDTVEEMMTALYTMTPMAPAQLTLRASTTADTTLVERCAAAARDGLADLRIHQNTVRSFSQTWIEQGARNLPHLARWPTIEDVGTAFAGLPMVIVAPGPSLAKNIAQLRELQGRAIICCFNHSLKPVLAAGIVPDVIVSVDPQDIRYHFEGCDLSRSYLVNGATVHPALFDLPARGTLTLASNGAIDSWLFAALGGVPEVGGGGSVATTAFSLALRWRCDPIVFLGLDLSFSGGRYYVETSTDGEARAEIDDSGKMRIAGWSAGFNAMKAHGGPTAAVERVIELPGWAGGTVQSSFSLAMFHRWFVDTMRGVRDRAVYNCTEGGARIEGMDHRAFAAVRDQLAAKLDVGAILDGVIAGTDRDARRAALAKDLDQHHGRLRRARKLADRARMLVDAGNERALQGTERALTQCLAASEFASLLAQREVERALDVAAHRAEHADYVAASRMLFETVVRVADDLLPILGAAREALEAAP
jgi:hypothetical protein